MSIVGKARCSTGAVLQGCEQALVNARPGSKVSCVPGMEAVTEKRRLATTLRAAYGEGAFAIIPRTYLLPEEYWRWQLSLKAQVSALAGRPSLSMHKGLEALCMLNVTAEATSLKYFCIWHCSCIAPVFSWKNVLCRLGSCPWIPLILEMLAYGS